MVGIFNASPSGLRLEDHEYEASLGYIRCHVEKEKKNIPLHFA
jgi:hypothetical protein